ncbi:uncharacterized protein SRS1_12978 [Sporisorium reilianum f. sp. reilianum]|uniref:CFA20 domain-containing protein n=1 Tax=Sporisorium reilianum f. sp. reilianum TaxID=72559 RepID=A0A2N8UBL5_9BASI|nr:uncharacterized protein SRS1_12978 [Sporisorium reilianum f. sp. reilianum]
MTAASASTSLFAAVVQPESLSLFSSTSSDPLALWALHQDVDLPEDSGIRLVIDDTNVTAPNDPGATHESFIVRSEDVRSGASSEPVLHIQSPAIRNAFIRSPAALGTELGIELPHISFQFKSIGSARPFALEVGIKDESGRRATIRVSSFQTAPKLYPAGATGTGPVLHLPLRQPDQDETSLTSWQVLTLDLQQLAGHLNDTSLLASSDTEGFRGPEQTFGRFHSITHVKIHANIRLRRVWCSRHLPDHDLPEFQLFS